MTEADAIEFVKKVQMIKCESQVSNQDTGGVILFGIDEAQQYELVGVYDAQDLQKKVNEQCKQMIPMVRPVFTSAMLDGKTIVIAEIPGIDIAERPCYYAGVGRTKGSYVRVGDSDEPMSDYEIYSYEAFRKKYQDDIRINERADMTVIELSRLNAYVDRIKEKNPNLSKISDEEIKKFLNMGVDGRPTLVCILLFSIYPQMLYPQYTINAMVVPGYEKGEVTDAGARFLDNVRIEGTIDEMLGQTMKFLIKNMKVQTIVDTQTGRRKDKTEYPVVALREAVLNALIHRDYSMHTEEMPIEVILYKDRIEIRNPGGLYGRMSLDTLGKTQPDTRNPVLARAMETLGITENRYSGIPTIQRELREAGLKEAVFADSRNEFMVTFYNQDAKVQNVQDGEESRSLLEFCQEPRSRKEIADFLGITTIYYVSQNYIHPLLESGQLKMTKPESPKSKNQKFYSV